MQSDSPKAIYRRLGRSGLRVSVPLLGAMSFGTPEWMPWVLPKEKALPILKAAWDHGINTIDTADSYSNGESERVVGDFIKEYNIPRKEIVILTKCFFVVSKGTQEVTAWDPSLCDQRDYANQYGLSRAAIFDSVEASLQRLGTSYIDLLQIHRYDHNTEAEETMKALHDLVQAGKVRYIGASSMYTWQFARMNHIAEKNGWTKFVSMQCEHSLLYREEEREMIPYCEFEGIGIIPWSPLAGGRLARPADVYTARDETFKAIQPPHTPAEIEVVGRVEEIAKKRNWSMAQVAMAWSVSKVSSPIIGATSVGRLNEAILGDKKLTEDEIKHLEEPYIPRPVRALM